MKKVFVKKIIIILLVAIVGYIFFLGKSKREVEFENRIIETLGTECAVVCKLSSLTNFSWQKAYITGFIILNYITIKFEDENGMEVFTANLPCSGIWGPKFLAPYYYIPFSPLNKEYTPDDYLVLRNITINEIRYIEIQTIGIKEVTLFNRLKELGNCDNNTISSKELVNFEWDMLELVKNGHNNICTLNFIIGKENYIYSFPNDIVTFQSTSAQECIQIHASESSIRFALDLKNDACIFLSIVNKEIP